MAQFVNSKEVSQTAGQNGNTYPAGPSEISTGGTTGQITKVISARRSSRRQWRMFEICLTVIVDALLLYLAFRLAHYLRYNVFFGGDLIRDFRNNLLGGREQDHYTSLSSFLPLEIGIIVGALLIFLLR